MLVSTICSDLVLFDSLLVYNYFQDTLNSLVVDKDHIHFMVQKFVQFCQILMPFIIHKDPQLQLFLCQKVDCFSVLAPILCYIFFFLTFSSFLRKKLALGIVST